MRTSVGLSIAALFGSLGYSSAVLAVPSLSCPDLDNPLTVRGDRTSQVPSVVTQLGTVEVPNFLYEFRVCNTSENTRFERTEQVIRDWELPFFGFVDPNDPSKPVQADGTDASKITNITVPEGWNFSVEAIGVENEVTGWNGVASWQDPNDPWRAFFDALFGSEANNPYNDVTHVLHFYTGSCSGAFEGGVNQCTGGRTIREGEGLGIALGVPDDSLFDDTFQFQSPFGTFNAPYQASWQDLPPRTGDPDFPIVGPTNDIIEEACALTANNCDRGNTVPEPGSLALLGLGLGALAQSRRKRKSV